MFEPRSFRAQSFFARSPLFRFPRTSVPRRGAWDLFRLQFSTHIQSITHDQRPSLLAHQQHKQHTSGLTSETHESTHKSTIIGAQTDITSLAKSSGPQMADSTSQNRRSRPPSFGSVMSTGDVDRDTPVAVWKASVRDNSYSEYSMALDEYDEDMPSPVSSRAPRISPRIRAAAATKKQHIQQVPLESVLEAPAPSPSTTGGGGTGSGPSPAKRIRRKITDIQLDALDKVFAQVCISTSG